MKKDILAILGMILISSYQLEAQNIKELVNFDTGSPTSVFGALIEYKNSIYYSGQDINGDVELWRFEANGVVSQVANINPTGSSYPNLFVIANDILYFTATDEAHGKEIWMYDGINAPSLVHDMRPGSAGSSISKLTVINNTLMYRAQDSPGNNHLRVYDGNGLPEKFSIKYPGATEYGSGAIVEHDGFVYYPAWNYIIQKTEFWKYDGLNAPIKMYTFNDRPFINNIVVIDDIFYINYNANGENRLASFDGVSEPTHISGASQSPSFLTPIEGILYFKGYSETFGSELYKYTPGGAIELVEDLSPGSLNSNPNNLANINNVLYFAAYTDAFGMEMYKYTPETGLEIVADLKSNGGSHPKQFTKFNNKIIFTAILDDQEIYTALLSYDPRPCITQTTSIEVSCAEVASICTPLYFTGGSGIISMDFSLSYDPLQMSVTGSPELGPAANSNHFDVLTFEETPGELRGIVYLKPGAPASAQLEGPNELVCINLDATGTLEGETLNFNFHDFESGSIVETVEGCETEPGKIDVVNAIYHSQLKYAGLDANNKSIGNNNGNPLGSTTSIFGVDQDCINTTSDLSNLNSSGHFSYDTRNGTSVKIIRDIPNSTAVNSAINSIDVLETTKIALGITPSPTISSLLSADVNQDGRITSIDASLISLRSTLGIKEFAHQKDWVFVTQDEIDSNPSFSNATRLSVPILPDCIDLSDLFANTCVDPNSPNKVAGFLLGDVSLTWKTNHVSGQLKDEKPGNVVFHFDKLEQLTERTFSLPISFDCNESIDAIDFDLKFKDSKVKIIDFVPVDQSNSHFWRVENETRLFGAVYSLNGLGNHGRVLNLILESERGAINEDIIGERKAFINDLEVEITLATTITGMHNFSTYPSPAHETLTISSLGSLSINEDIIVTTINGQVIKQFSSENSQEQTIDISDLSSGLYLLQVGLTTKKIFIE